MATSLHKKILEYPYVVPVIIITVSLFTIEIYDYQMNTGLNWIRLFLFAASICFEQ